MPHEEAAAKRQLIGWRAYCSAFYARYVLKFGLNNRKMNFRSQRPSAPSAGAPPANNWHILIAI
jgi:hypothetical protein